MESRFVDYLFLAFNTSTAFSPTDVPVLRVGQSSDDGAIVYFAGHHRTSRRTSCKRPVGEGGFLLRITQPLCPRQPSRHGCSELA
jgi:hypothetical protein